MLTIKQMCFCQEYVKNGGNGKEAYLAAFESNNPTTAKVEATRLLSREDIQEYLLQLRKPIEKAVKRKIINEREHKKQIIQDRLEACIAREDDAAIARYLEIWNKMDGEYININKDITDRETDIANLDIKTLQQLAKGEETDTAATA